MEELNEVKMNDPKEKETIENKIDATMKAIKHSMEQFLMDHLSCEMYHFVLNMFYSSHLILRYIYLFFTLLGFGLTSYMTIDLVLTYF